MAITASNTIAAIQNILNIQYSKERVSDAVIHRTETWKRMIEGAGSDLMENFNPVGKNFTIRVKKSNAGGFGGISSTGALPTPTSSAHEIIDVNPVWHSGQISFDLRALLINGISKAQTAMNTIAAVNQLEDDIDGLISTAADYYENNLHATTPGILSSVGVGAAVAYGGTNTTITLCTNIDNISAGQRIDIRTGATQRGTYTVAYTTVTNTTTRVGTIAVVGDASGDSITAGDDIYLEYVYGQTGGELIGLATAIKSTGAYPNYTSNNYIDRDTAGNDYWKSQYYDGSGDSDVEDSFANFMNQMQNYGWGSNFDEAQLARKQFIVANWIMKNRIGLDTQNQFMRYMMTKDGMTPDIGAPIVNPLTYAGFPFVPAARCPKTVAKFVDPSTWAVGKLVDAEPTGPLIGDSKLQIQAGYVTGVCGYIWGMQLFCKNPRFNGDLLLADVSLLGI